MNKPPKVYGLVLCERVRVELNPASFNLDGLFLGREFAKFPTARLEMAVYAALFDGRGEGVMELTCTHLETEADIYYHGMWWGFSRSIPTVHYARSLKKLLFREPGRYAFTLAFDKTPLTVRYLDVREVRR